jgi:hypothetical protein
MVQYPRKKSSSSVSYILLCPAVLSLTYCLCYIKSTAKIVVPTEKTFIKVIYDMEKDS